MSRLHTGLAAELCKLLALGAVFGPDDELAVGEVGLVLALDGNLALLHADVHHGLVLHVLVPGSADIHSAILIFKHITYRSIYHSSL